MTQIQKSHNSEMCAYLTNVSSGLISFWKSFEIPPLQTAGNVKHTFKAVSQNPR